MKTLTVTRVLGGHESRVTCASISPQVEPDSEGNLLAPYRAPLRIASCSFDKTWKTWEYDALSDSGSAVESTENGENGKNDENGENGEDAMDIA